MLPLELERARRDDAWPDEGEGEGGMAAEGLELGSTGSAGAGLTSGAVAGDGSAGGGARLGESGGLRAGSAAAG